MKASRLAVFQKDCCRKIAISLKIPAIEYQSVSDTSKLGNVVRKVESKLLHLRPDTLTEPVFSPTGPDAHCAADV
jgi:hypothetical protein